MNSPTPRELLELRLMSGSTRANRHDGAHLALVLEGGGMRGVVSVAMAAGFEERGYFDAFDSIHGSSAGACGATYFAAGRASYGGRIYFEDINNRKFIDVRRPLIGRPIMNKDFLIDNVMRLVKPFDVQTIAQSPGFLNIIATDVLTGAGRQFDTFDNLDQLLNVLRASICLPLIAGKSVTIDGVELVDGGIAQQIALESAASKDATHAIVLMTRTEDESLRPTKVGVQADALTLGLVYGSRLRAAYEARNQLINESVNAVYQGRYIRADGVSMSVDAIARKPNSTHIGRLCIDGTALATAFGEGRQATFAYLSL